MAKHDPVPVGQRYGEWIVLGYARTSYWNCKCSCGDEHAVRIANLRNGTSSRCIKCQRLNATPPPNKQKIFCEIGKSYGFWRVLRASDRPGYYECRCESCGKRVQERRNIHLMDIERFGKQCQSCAAKKAGKMRRLDPNQAAPICTKHEVLKTKTRDRSRANGFRWVCHECAAERNRKHRFKKTGIPCKPAIRLTEKFIPGETQFGNWTYLGVDSNVRKSGNYLVRCHCGYEGSRNAQALRNGKSLECRTCYEKGRLRELQRKDLTGLVIGNLTCESFSHNIMKANGNKGSAVWNWRCECGNTTKRTKSSLETDQKKPGNQVSCKPCSDTRGAILREINFIGQTIGELTCLRRLEFNKQNSGSLHEWECSCGNKVKRTPASVKHNGGNPSCGCQYQYGADRAGEKFGSLLALRSLGKKPGESTYTWEFRCDCGNLHQARLRDCVQGKIVSCGCQPRGNDNIQRWLDGTFYRADVSQYFYVYPLQRFPGYTKPGIAEDLIQRESNAKGEYGEIHDFIELSRLDAWLLEQAVLHATRLFTDCPKELEECKWGGWTEVRRMEPKAVFDLALELEEQFREMGRERFAAQFIPMNPEQRQLLIASAPSRP